AAAVLSAGGGERELPMGRCLDTLAAATAALGRMPEAERACRGALTIRLGLLSDDDPEVGESLGRLAAILETRGEAAESMDLARAAEIADVRGFAGHLQEVAQTVGA